MRSGVWESVENLAKGVLGPEEVKGVGLPEGRRGEWESVE